jgi:chloramphenicol O-acetyltransferase type A
MRTFDMQTWPRREHFKLFNQFHQPHFGMSANMDVTAFVPLVKERGYSLTTTVVYVIARAANAVPGFRLRIREGQVVEHDVVHPSFTVLVEGDVFGFCSVEYSTDYHEFAARAVEARARLHGGRYLAVDLMGGELRDDLMYMSPIPWVSFTSFMHPMPFQPPDSIPRFAWGKIFEEGGALKMPLAAQGHHALMDGIHMGQFYERVQDCLRWPEAICEKA